MVPPSSSPSSYGRRGMARRTIIHNVMMVMRMWQARRRTRLARQRRRWRCHGGEKIRVRRRECGSGGGTRRERIGGVGNGAMRYRMKVRCRPTTPTRETIRAGRGGGHWCMTVGVVSTSHTRHTSIIATSYPTVARTAATMTTGRGRRRLRKSERGGIGERRGNKGTMCGVQGRFHWQMNG